LTQLRRLPLLQFGSGPRYLGLVQWAVAAEAGEDLAALAIQVSASQFHGQTYAGGSLSLETAASWLVLAIADAEWVSFALLVLVPIVVPVGFIFVVGQAGLLLDVRVLITPAAHTSPSTSPRLGASRAQAFSSATSRANCS